MNLKEKIEIKSLSGIDWRCVTLEFDEMYLHIYFTKSKEKPDLFTSDYKILEESKLQNWGKGINGRFDRSNYGLNNPNKDHLHVYKKNNQLFAINRDGSAHDDSHKYQIPNKIANRIRKDYADFNLPDDNFIESIEINNTEANAEILYLLEAQ